MASNEMPSPPTSLDQMGADGKTFDYAAEKRANLWKLIGVFVIAGAWDGAFPWHDPDNGELVEFFGLFVRVAAFLGIGVYSSHWCYWDDLEQGRKPNKQLAALIIVMPLIGVPVYLLRGHAIRALIVTLQMFVFWLCLTAVAGFSAWLVEMVIPFLG